MSDFSKFMKKHKTVKENTTYAATKTLTDESGEPLLWEIKPISTREADEIADSCTYEVPVTGKPGMYRSKINMSKYKARMICASVVYPDLNNKELQDSYGVMDAESLIVEMVDNANEYNAFMAYINDYNELSPLQEDVDKAKN